MSKDVVINGKKVPKELLEIIIKRIEAMPNSLKLAVLGEMLSKKDIIKAIYGGTEIGKEILDIEIKYYKDLVRN